MVSNLIRFDITYQTICNFLFDIWPYRKKKSFLQSYVILLQTYVLLKDVKRTWLTTANIISTAYDTTPKHENANVANLVDNKYN